MLLCPAVSVTDDMLMPLRPVAQSNCQQTHEHSVIKRTPPRIACGPVAAAGVPRVDVLAAVALEFKARQRQDNDAPIDDWAKCCDEQAHIRRHLS